MFDIVVKRRKRHGIPFVHRIEMSRNRHSVIISQRNERIGIGVEIGILFLVLVQQNQQIPIGIGLEIATGAGAIEIQMPVSGDNLPAELLDLIQYVV